MEGFLEIMNNFGKDSPVLFLVIVLSFLAAALFVVIFLMSKLKNLPKFFKGATINVPGGSTISLGSQDDSNTQETNNISENKIPAYIFSSIVKESISLGFKNSQKRAELFDTQMGCVSSTFNLIKNAILESNDFNNFPKNLEIVLEEGLIENFRNPFRQICVQNHIAQKDEEDFLKDYEGFSKTISNKIYRYFISNTSGVEDKYHVDLCKNSIENQKDFIESQTKKCLKGIKDKADIALKELEESNVKMLKNINDMLSAFTDVQINPEVIPDVPVDTIGEN